QPASDSTASDSTASDSLPPEEVTIRAGHSNWIEESFQTQVVNLGLEQLGYQLDSVKELEYPALYLSVASDDVDYSVAYYQPGHEESFENAGGEAKISGLGIVMPPGIQGYLIDKKTADEYGITNIEQFQDPEVAQLFDFDGDGKANLTGCNPGWGCEAITNHFIEVYGLQDTVEHDQGAYATLLADAITRYEAGEPIFYYAYNPHWVGAILKPGEDVVWLEVPFTSLPEDMGDLTEEDTTFDGKNLGLPGSQQRIMANPAFLAQNPIAKRWLELVQIPIEDMNEVSLRINEGEDTPEDIRQLAEQWVSDNQEQFDQWIAEAQSAGE
ncbi:glycine betaine/L-proline ABC transporter substrate-binding protein ProX, partial [Spirulina sp.]